MKLLPSAAKLSAAYACKANEDVGESIYITSTESNKSYASLRDTCDAKKPTSIELRQGISCGLLTTSGGHTLQFLHLSTLTLFLPQLFRASHRSSLDRFLAAKRLECIVEEPLGRVFHGLVEHVGEEGDGS